MIERTLQGPFLTRAQAARRAHVPARLIPNRPDLLALGGGWLQEVYFGFQFDEDGVVPEIGTVVQALKERFPDVAIADWMVRPNPALNRSTPLRYLRAGGEVERVVAAADRFEPVCEPVADEPPRPTLREPVPVPTTRPARRRVKRVAAWQSLVR